MGRATVSEDYAAQQDEWAEVEGGGDFAPIHKFEDDGDLVGTYLSTEEKVIKGEDRIIHHFMVDGEPVDTWGAAILNSRLADVPEGSRVKVIKTGKSINTKGGRQAKEFKVYVARSALRG